MDIVHNQSYARLLRTFCMRLPIWEEINGKRILISGATGMIGSFLVDAIMLHNQEVLPEKRCEIIALGRHSAAARERFSSWMSSNEFTFIEQDINLPLPDGMEHIDCIIHAASTTHPRAYSTEPVNTILANIIGTKNLLEVAAKNHSSFLLMSSVEIYGENRGDVEYFDEAYCGYIDCNTLRAGYPEGKRASEALCQAYIRERGVEAKIIRLSRVYGPTMRQTDSKALAQFIHKGVAREDIVLKSAGNQLYSYLHVFDAVQAVLWVLFRGACGEAYNAADQKSDITLKELAKQIADYAGTKVVFELPDETEKQGYSTATKAVMDASKLKSLGWQPCYEIRTGLCETIDILRELK